MADSDTVRLLVGDTDSGAQLLSDANITAFLNERSLVDSDGGTVGVNVVAAAADAAGAIAAQFAREFNFATDGQRFDRAQKVGHYQALERQLRNRQGGYSQPITLAGTETT